MSNGDPHERFGVESSWRRVTESAGPREALEGNPRKPVTESGHDRYVVLQAGGLVTFVTGSVQIAIRST